MKIFMVHEDPWHAGNPYISTLIEQIQATHPDSEVAWGRERFWSQEIFSYDIVHFHWPQAFMAYDSHTLQDLLSHLELMKASGVRIVATCHDLEPHYSQCADKAESLTTVYSHCDAVFHLACISVEMFRIVVSHVFSVHNHPYFPVSVEWEQDYICQMEKEC